MNWSILLLLACPLMMLFCMKGMFFGNKKSKGSPLQPDDLKSLQIKMADLMEQNHKLSQEVENLKVLNNNQKVVNINK